MCLTFHAKGRIETEEMIQPVQIRKRYNPVRRETTLELVRPRKAGKVGTTFWFCECGSRMHIDLLICSDCGKHQEASHVLPGEVKKLERIYEGLRKGLRNVERDLQDIRKDSGGKEPCDNRRPVKEKCCCVSLPPDEQNRNKCPDCTCNDQRPRQCECSKLGTLPAPPRVLPDCPEAPCVPCNPTPHPRAPPAMMPYPSPNIPPVALLPVPGHFPRHPPPDAPPPPDFNSSCPVQPLRPDNGISPECREIKRRRSHHRDRSPSISSSSTVTNRSFERLKTRVVGLGRRISRLENRDGTREEQRRFDQIEEEIRRVRDLEEIARRREELVDERRRNDEVEYSRRRNITRNQGQRRDRVPEIIRILPFPSGTSCVRRRHRSSFADGGPVMDRWDEERCGHIDDF